jgi:hypothetical protein
VQKGLMLSEESLEDMINSSSDKDENEVMVKNSIMFLEDLSKGMLIASNIFNHFMKTARFIECSLNLMRGLEELMDPDKETHSVHAIKSENPLRRVICAENIICRHALSQTIRQTHASALINYI